MTTTTTTSYSNFTPSSKARFHRDTARLLRRVATELGLSKGEYDLRSNKGGVAVLGEVTLHSDTLYLQVGCSFGEPVVLYRSCEGRKDYHGGANRYVPYARFVSDLPACIEAFRAVL